MKVHSITALILHAFRHNNIPFNYPDSPGLKGIETLTDLHSGFRIAVIEGGEDATPPFDFRPEFRLYRPNIAVINNITGDHTKISSTSEDYHEQISVLASAITPGGSLLYYVNDPEAEKVAAHCRDDIRKVPYDIHGYMVNKTGCYAVTINRMVKVGFSGDHNMQNLSAAREVCLTAGLTEDQFYAAIGAGLPEPACNPLQ